MKTYTATVMINFAVEVEVEAENEDDARQLLDEKAWESYFKTTGESELYDFMEVRSWHDGKSLSVYCSYWQSSYCYLIFCTGDLTEYLTLTCQSVIV